VKESPAEKAPKNHQDAENAELKHSKDPGKRQKVKADNHRTPVGREVGAMKSIGQDRNAHDGNDLNEGDEQKPFENRLSRRFTRFRGSLAVQAAFPDEIN
jgi:hypothetical protein